MLDCSTIDAGKNKREMNNENLGLGGDCPVSILRLDQLLTPQGNTWSLNKHSDKVW